MVRLAALLAIASGVLQAQSGADVLLVVNGSDAASREIAAYYRPRRSVPVRNVCTLRATSSEEVSWSEYQEQIETPVRQCLEKAGLREQVLYIATTLGVPLKISGGGSGMTTEYSSVDSELALLYGKMQGNSYPRPGGVANPYFMRTDAPFRHPQFPIYLVTRLAAWDVADVKAMIDRSLAARNRGRFVVDLNTASDDGGNGWLRAAAAQLPKERVLLDETPNVVYDARDVIAYAGWGSNDKNRKRRHLGYTWLPGAIATEFVSTNARTIKRPPDDWTYTIWGDLFHYFGGSPQGLTGDLLHDGATGATGNVYEPYLAACARPDYLLPAWNAGRNLAESYYVSIHWLSWQGVMFGDPLCSLGKP